MLCHLMWKMIALRNRSGKLSVQLEICTFLVLTVHMPRGYQDSRGFRINVLITLAIFIFIFSLTLQVIINISTLSKFQPPQTLQRMQVENSSVKTQFFLLGVSDHPELQSVLFPVFLSIYSVNPHGETWDDFINHNQSPFAHPYVLFFFTSCLS